MLHRSVQIAKHLSTYHCGKLRPKAGENFIFMYNQRLTRLFHRFEYRFLVQRNQRTDIYNLYFPPLFFLQPFRSIQTEMRCISIRNDT